MARVLVTYGWCRTSYLIARSLAARGHTVYACSSRRPAAASWSRFTRGGAVVRDPFEEPEAFVEDVARLVRRWGIDAVFPGHEDAIPLRAGARRLPEGVTLVCPPLRQLLRAVDKGVMTQAATAAGISVPDTAYPSSLEEAQRDARRLGFPLVLKLRRSNGGKGVRVVHSLDELTSLWMGPWISFSEAPHSRPLLQRFVRGSVVGGCFIAEAGTPIAVFGERYLRTKDAGFGTSTYRRPEPMPALLEATKTMARALGWSGIGHFDFLEEAGTGRLQFLEMNPRPWGAIHLAYINGFDFPAAALAQAMGEGALEGFFPANPDLGHRHSVWLVGEGIRLVSRFKDRRRSVETAARPTQHTRLDWRVARPDGFVWSDPGAFVAECLCYLGEFARARGDVNPHSDGMLGDPLVPDGPIGEEGDEPMNTNSAATHRGATLDRHER